MVMDVAQLRALYDQDQRQDIEYPGDHREVVGNVVRNVNLSGHRGSVIYSELNDDTADATIEAQIDYFAQIGQTFEWKVFEHDQPSDLKERLAAHGFEIGDVEAIMVLPLTDLPLVLRTPIEHDVRCITDPSLVKSVLSIQTDVWGHEFDFLHDYLAGQMANNPDYLAMFAAYADDQPVCSAWINFPKSSQFAGLWGGATRPGYRNRGYYTAVLAVRAQEALRRDRQILTVDASPMSRPILEKLGFVRISSSWECVWHAHKEDA